MDQDPLFDKSYTRSKSPNQDAGIKHLLIPSDSNKSLLDVPLRSPSRSPNNANIYLQRKKSNDVAFLKGESNILVAVRSRPLSEKELESGSKSIVNVIENTLVVLTDPNSEENANTFFRKNRVQSFSYAFDHAFDFQATQREIFESTTLHLVPVILDGFNATVFAYGATGAGKTHTMLGTDSQMGIMGQTLDALFQDIQSRKNVDKIKYSVTLSYLEVYNENIRDLFVPTGEYLDLREDGAKGVVVAGITELSANSAHEIMGLLAQGNRYRTTESTAANKVSSRSHAVLQVVVEAKDESADIAHSVKVGKLSMIDLAGSERASVTQNRGIRLFEGANINRSLLALANCINALGEIEKHDGSLNFVPYRDSKLTRLLKDSLGGNSRTIMIANISPSEFSYEETHNTLKYANRAKNIKTKITRNVKNVEYHVSQYRHIISELRDEIAVLKNQMANSVAQGGMVKSPSSSGLGHHNFNEMVANEQALFEKLQSGLVSNFNEMFKFKRSLVDLEENRLCQIIEMNNCLLDIDESDDKLDKNMSGVMSKKIRLAFAQINDIKEKIRKADENKSQLQEQFLNASQIAIKLNDQLRLINHPMLKGFLTMQFNMQNMQIENMDLEQSGILQQIVIKQRDLNILKLEAQLKLRDNIINEQIQSIKTHAPDHAIPPKNDELTNLARLHREASQGYKLMEDIQSPPKILKKNMAAITSEYYVSPSKGQMNNIWPSISSSKATKITIQKPTPVLPEINRSKLKYNDNSASDSVPETKPARRMSFQTGSSLPMLDKNKLSARETEFALPSINSSPAITPRSKRSTFAGGLLPLVREQNSKKLHMNINLIPISNTPQVTAPHITAGLENLLSKMKSKETSSYKMRQSTNIKQSSPQNRNNDISEELEESSSTSSYFNIKANANKPPLPNLIKKNPPPIPPPPPVQLQPKPSVPRAANPKKKVMGEKDKSLLSIYGI